MKTAIEIIADALQASGVFVIDVLVPEQCLSFCLADGVPIHVTAEGFANQEENV